MRHAAIIALAAVSLLAAPAATAVPARAQDATPAACAPATPEDNRIVALDWYQAITDRDLGRFDALMSPDTFYGAATVDDVAGPQAVREIYQQVLGGFTNLVYTPQQVVAADDYVAIRFVADGDNTGEFRGAAPTGKHIAWTGIGIMQIECGRIARTWMETDQLSRMLALGTAQDIPAVAALTTPVQPAAPEPGPAPACEETTSEHTRLVFFAWDEAWDTGNISLLDGLLTDHAAGTEEDMAAGAAGTSLIDGMSRMVAAFHEAMPDFRSDVDFAFADDEYVVAHWVDHGTMTGEFHGVPPAGEPVAYTGITMLRLDCGRISENWYQFSAGDLLDQMKADWRK